MDKNGKIFGKINLIDLLVIIALIAAVFGIGLRFISKAAADAKNETSFRYVIKVEGIRDYSIEALQKKGKLLEITSESDMGDIIEIKSEPQTRQHITDAGVAVEAEIPERYNAYITVDSKGKESDDKYFIGNEYELSVGTTMNVFTKYVNSSGRVTKVEKLEK